MKTYQEIVDYIYQIPKFTKKNSEVTSRAFFDFLKKPGSNQKIIHVAGTNGKGSICAYLNQILIESEHSVGMFTSPHLVYIEERFQINGVMIARDKFVALFQDVFHKIILFQDKNPSYHPTFFELLFFMAMQYFEKEKVEIIILETGLGGRLDATNIIAEPLISVISKIGFDHMEFLGNSLYEIASEKAGIIKRNIPVVYWSEEDEVNKAIIEKATKEHAKLYPISNLNVKIEKNRDKKIDFSYNSSYYKDMYCKLNTVALYQVENALLAIKVIEAIRNKISVNKEEILAGLYKTKWPGRMEEVSANVYLDGAHNVDGMKAMLQGISFIKGEKDILLFSAVKDKNYEGMIFELSKVKEFTEICITKIPGDRGINPSVIEEIFRKYGKENVCIIENVTEAYQVCKLKMQEQKEIHAMYVVGSLYLVGLIKEIIDSK